MPISLGAVAEVNGWKSVSVMNAAVVASQERSLLEIGADVSRTFTETYSCLCSTVLERCSADAIKFARDAYIRTLSRDNRRLLVGIRCDSRRGLSPVPINVTP